jgi:thiamine pyrophosphokinase
MKATIIAHGSLNDDNILLQECETADVIICADGGAEYAKRLEIKPDYLIGDFDSISNETYEYFVSSGTAIEVFPTEKDYTDTELCINKALSLGCDQICIAAGIGGRLDHSLGNIGLLYYILQNNAKGYITGAEACVYLCNNELVIDGKIGDTVSIIPFRGNAIGVTLKGFKYPLTNALVEFGRPIGISNELVCSKGEIQIKNGELLVIRQLKL